MRYVSFACVVALCFLAGCSTYRNPSIMVDKKLIKKDYTNRSIGFYPIHTSEMEILNPDDVKRCFPEDVRSPEEVVADSINTKGYEELQIRVFKIQLQEKASGCGFIPESDTTKFFHKKYNCTPSWSNVIEDSISFHIPTEESLSEIGLIPDIILIFYKISIDYHKKSLFGMNHDSGYLSFLSPRSFSPQINFQAVCQAPSGFDTMLQNQPNLPQSSLTASVTFILWDYSVSAPICWGKFGVSELIDSFSGDCDINTWNSLFRNITSGALSSTNFLFLYDKGSE